LGVIQQVGQFSGNPYSFTIAGDTPTEQEAARISQILDQQELPFRQRYEAQYGGIASLGQPVEEEDDETAIRRGLRTGAQTVKSLFGTAVEETGRGLGFETLEEFGAGMETAAEQRLRELQEQTPTTRLEDVEGIGTGLTYAGEVVGQQAPILGTTLAGAGLGFLAGGPFGAIAGGAAASFPLLFGGNVQRQEEQVAAGELESVNIEKALIAAGGQAAIEGIAGRILALAPFAKGTGSLWTRVPKGAAVGVAAEVPTEITQQLIERAQAGLPIDSDDAIKEYVEAGVAAGILGGGIGSFGGAVQRDRTQYDKDRELNEDIIESAAETRERIGYADQISQDITAEVEAQTEAALEAETQEAKVRNAPEPMALAEVTTDEEFKDKTFNKAQYDRVLQQVKADIERNKPISVTGIQQNVKKDIKDTKVSQVRDVMAELENRGYLQSTPQPAAVRDRATGVRYTPTPQYQATQNIEPQLKTPDVSYRRQIDIANEAIEKNNRIIQDLALDLDSVREYGRDLQGKRTTENVINEEIKRLSQRNAQYTQVANDAQQGLQRLGNVPYVPRITPEFNRAQKIERKVAAAKARSVADQVKEKVQSNKPVFTPALNEKQDKVLKSIRKRLDGYGLKDVRLSAEQIVDGGEGSYNPTGRVISLSMGLYDPNLSETELFNRVGEVLDHETTHALKEMNVIKPAEWKSLTDAASKVKYTKLKGDEKQQRKYTYLDRAKRLYGDMDAEIQSEEAVAEMFRDYNAGRLSLAGKPKTLFEKIKNFFKSIVGGTVDNGFTDVQSIFDDIVVGNIGQRERGEAAIQQTEPAARQSRIFATEEEFRPEEEIRMPINVAAPNDQVRAQIQRMTNQNRPLVKRLIKRIDDRYGTKSGDNAKDLSKVTQKARRPSILANKPWHDVSHIRDSYRFKTVIDDFRAVPAIFDELLADGIELVKIDTNKLFKPKEWGWRIIAFDLRMPNGQLVEWYLPLKELEVEKKARGHLIFEEWRNKTQEELSRQREEYFNAIARSYRNYDEAFEAALDRMGVTRQDAEASWRSAESSLLDAARNARSSSGVGISSAGTAEEGIIAPSEVRTDVEPSALNISAREEPSSISAKGSAILSTSDDYVTDVPVEEQVKFSRLPRTSNVSGLQDFIRNNPEGFTIDPVTMEPASGGFVVAPLKEAEIIVGETLPEEVLLGYIEDNKDISAAVNKPVYLGGWFDSDSQQYFLDNTLILPTAEEALYIAEAADQLAIFDLNNFEEIRTNEGIRRLQESGAYRGDTAIGYQRNLAEVGRRFAEARDNRNTRQKEQLTGGVEGFRQSRLPLTPEQRAASILDYLDPDTGQPKFKNPQGSETLVSFANKLLELRGTRSYDIVNSEQDREEVARIMAAEAEAALLSSSDAIGWYDAKLKLAKQILFPVYPEVSRFRPDGTENALYDPASEHAFDYATAVTSNGLSVIDNYLLASRQYDAWKNSQDGRFPLSSSGKQGQSMIKAWEFWNALTDLGYDSNQINELLTMQMRKGDLAALMTDVFGVERVKDLPFKIDGKELADEIVGVAYVIGPKIGNGFYQNLRGNFNPLTMDRWWMRFVNRITGNPTVNYRDELVQENKDKLWELISNPDRLTDMDKKLLVDTVESLDIATIEKSDIELIAPQVQKIWDKNFYNKAFNDKLDELADQYDFVVTSGGTISGRDANKVKKIAQDARPKSTDLALAAKNLAGKLKPELQEDPRNARERSAMRAAANRARDLLSQLGVNLTNADFQALMWYAEKRIFEAGGVRKGRGDDNDYADGAIAILKNKGVSDDKIKATLPDSERGRISGVKSQLDRDSEIGREIDAIQRGPEEGNFFAPRELTLLDGSMAAQEQLTTQQQRDTAGDLAGLEVDPELPPQRFSRMVPADALVPVRAPVNLRDGSPNPVYGYFMDRGRLRPIVLPKGSHKTYESGVEVGQGLFHIQQRNHDKELVENSKYKRVENAIYDLLRRWQDQGYDDGASVISYPSQGGIVLEWRDNLAFKAPPMRLVLQSGRDLPNAPAKDVFYVKTFFPILEKKARKVAPVRASRMFSTLPQQIENKKYDLNYARAADVLAKGLGFAMPKAKAQTAADTIIRKFQDNMLPVGRMIQELKKAGATITDAFDSYLQEELYHGRVGAEIESREKTIYKDAVDAVKGVNIAQSKIDQLKIISDKASETGDGFVKKALDSYPSKKLAVVDAVLYATHAKERNAFIRQRDPDNTSGSGMSDREADAILAWVATLDAPSVAALQRVQQGVRSIVGNTNQARADYGLIPDDMRTDTNFNSYVPLRGKVDMLEDEMDYTRPAGGAPFGVRGREDRRALGRFDYATDILATVINQNQNSVVRGERNKVGQAFIGLLRANPDKTRGYGRILDRMPTRRVLDSSGKVREIPDMMAGQDPNIFVAKENGKDVFVELSDVRLANALKGVDGTGPSSLDTINRALGKLNRYLSNINTSYNPEFFITNIVRDIQTAGINVQQFDADGMVKSIAKDYGKAFGGIKRAIRNGDTDSEWAKIYADFVRDGGQNSANPMNSVADQMANISNLLGDIAEDGVRGKFNKMKNSFVGEKTKSLLKFLEDYNTVAENAVRVAVYKGLKDKGFSNERAAQAARNVTVNFGKGGEMKTLMNSYYLFYNASIQGSFALFNAFLRSPKVRKLWGGLIVAGVMQDALNAMLSEEDDDEIKIYDKIPDYILEHNLILPTFGMGERSYLAIPLPYGLNMAVNAGRAFNRTLRGEYSASEGANSIFMTAVDALNPIGGTENMANFVAPTVADPFIEIMRNENYAGVPIYKQQYPGDQSPDSQRYFNSVSPSARWVTDNLNSLTGGTSEMSGFVDWNPEIMDYWFEYLTGGIGRFVQRTAEAPARIYTDGFSEDLSREIPFVRKVIGSVSERENIGLFVEKRDRILNVGQEIKAAQEAGDRARFMRAREKYSEEIALLPRIKAINNAIKKISRQQNAIRDNVNLPDSQRQLLLDRLDEQKQMLYARGNMMMKDYR
jgi:hypothetical protein